MVAHSINKDAEKQNSLGVVPSHSKCLSMLRGEKKNTFQMLCYRGEGKEIDTLPLELKFLKESEVCDGDA